MLPKAKVFLENIALHCMSQFAYLEAEPMNQS